MELSVCINKSTRNRRNLWKETKPFEIAKQAVKIAFERVKANKGTYGIDEQSISDFELDLKNNLYKIWNRMSSGTYFPKPVKAVAIPKKNGGTRILGIPTVEDKNSTNGSKDISRAKCRENIS